jgi:hypothetical protein
LPEEYQFDWPFDIIKVAWWLWAMSDFQRLPTQDEIMLYDARYISDMQLASEIYAYTHNQHPLMRAVEAFHARGGFGEDGKGTE